VVACILGVKIEFVTLFRGDGFGGAAMTHSATFLARGSDVETRLLAMEKDCKTVLAGPHAQAKQAGRWPPRTELCGILGDEV
jgi:hypothetical protein